MAKKLSRKQRRIAVAKDVIDRLNIRKHMNMTHYSYFDIDCDGREEIEETHNKRIWEIPANEAVNVITPNCKVCGIGGMFLGYLQFTDDLTVDDVACVDQDGIIDILSDTFTETEMLVIEDIYENVTNYYYPGYSPEDEKNISSHIRAYRKHLLRRAHLSELDERADRAILRGICRDIIDNDGKLVLPELPHFKRRVIS